jgi:hypothetical protein
MKDSFTIVDEQGEYDSSQGLTYYLKYLACQC